MKQGSPSEYVMRQLAAKYKSEPKSKKAQSEDQASASPPANHTSRNILRDCTSISSPVEVHALLRLCTCADETTSPPKSGVQDCGDEVAQLLFDSVIGHWKSKSADAVLADVQQTDFEQRLHVFKTLGARLPGYEREVLLACAHSTVEDLKMLAEPGPEPVEAPLRRLAQAAVEGLSGRPKVAKVAATRQAQVPAQGPESFSLHRPTREGCAVCNQITDASRETLSRLRLACSRATAAERRAAQRVRIASALAASAKARFTLPAELQSHEVCGACKQGGDELLLFPCGHVAHAACLDRISRKCSECQLSMEADEGLRLNSLQAKPEAPGKKFSSKVTAVSAQLKRILTETKRSAQCLVFAQWQSAFRQLEAALVEEGMTPLVADVTQAERKDAGEDVDKRIILFPPEFLQALSKANASSTVSIWFERLVAPSAVRHILLLHPLHAAPVKRQMWERTQRFQVS